MKKLLAASFICCQFMLSAVGSQAQDKLTEKNYRIYSTKLQKEVTLADIAKDMADYDVLFFGEEHNDSVTHYLEHQMLMKMHEQFGSKVALSMEMFERDVQAVMDEYLADAIREKHFKKDARVWSNYRDYRPMVEFAKTNKLDVICANAAARYTNLAGRKGQEALKELPDASKDNFAPLPYAVATGGYLEKLEAMSGHAPSKDTGKAAAPAAMPGMGDFNLITAQSLWDATMAYSIASYLKSHKKQKVMQVNGRFHSDEGFAAATQLNNYLPKAKKLVISTSSDEQFPNINWKEYAKNGDYIIITDPSVPRTYSDK